MKIDTNIVAHVAGHKKYYKILAFLLVALYLSIGVSRFFAAYQPIIRDFYIANVAHSKAGPVVPFEDDVYLRGFTIDPDNIYAYGMESNNTWMADQTRLIVPYFSYEKVAPVGLYPPSIGSVPMYNGESFHIAGRMIPYPEGYVALLNERLFIDNRWNDQRRALEVLVHELVHVQGGNYMNGDSESLEPATSVATVEVLAGMCNYQHELGCESFWLEIEHLARTSLHMQLKEIGYGHLYETWAYYFWRTPEQQVAYDKAMRRWSEDPEGLQAILRKYQLGPWSTILEKVVTGGTGSTGLKACTPIKCAILGMPFDDIAYLFQSFDWLME